MAQIAGKTTPNKSFATTGHQSGILNDEAIETLIEEGVIRATEPWLPNQIQPASLDVRLGHVAYRVRASFLPGQGRTVATCLQDLTLHTIALDKGAVLETGCVYIVPLQESCTLPANLLASANPKSSTGRLDVFTRVITDGSRAFDTIPAGYDGPLYLEISPRTFPVLVRPGTRLSQVRFRHADARLSDEATQELHRLYNLTPGSEPLIDGGLQVSVDLSKGLSSGLTTGSVIGYRARRHTGVIDVEKIGAYDQNDFFEPLPMPSSGRLILDPGQFYILASREKVHIPPHVAAEMVAIDPLMGEFRVHYAGFFDPGFGHLPEGSHGARAVLEVRSHDVPFVLEHGQPVARLQFEALAATPRTLYGASGSNYQAQGLKLAKHFR